MIKTYFKLMNKIDRQTLRTKPRTTLLWIVSRTNTPKVTKSTRTQYKSALYLTRLSWCSHATGVDVPGEQGVRQLSRSAAALRPNGICGRFAVHAVLVISVK